jgi:hypothetical protein
MNVIAESEREAKFRAKCDEVDGVQTYSGGPFFPASASNPDLGTVNLR